MRKKYLIFGVLGVVLVVLVLIAIFYKIYISASTLTDSINPNIKLSQILTTGEAYDAPATNAIEISIPSGEKESLAVLLRNESTANYPSLTISKDDLVSTQGNRILKDNIDERVIHNWGQKLIDWSKDRLAPVPGEFGSVKVDELLVKNDKPGLNTPADPKYNGNTFFSSDIAAAPMAQLLTSGGSSQAESSDGASESIKTAVQANSSKKFYFTIGAPSNSAGDFSGNIDFVDKQNMQTVARFRLKVKVLPFNLVSLNEVNDTYQTGCYFNDVIAKDSANPANNFHQTEQLVTKRLTLAHENGCEKIIIRAGKDSKNSKILDIIQDLKFKGPVIINFGTKIRYDNLSSIDSYSQFKNFLNEIKNDSTLKLPLMFYGIDEPNITKKTVDGVLVENTAKYDNHKQRVDNIQKALAEVFTSGLPQNISNRVTTSATQETWIRLGIDGARYTTEYPIVNYKDPSFLDLSKAYRDGTATINGFDSYYFQGYNEIQNNWGMQNINRYLAGIGVAKSGLKGYMINPVYGYQNINPRPLYDDYTIPLDDIGKGSWKKQMMIFYPASDGFIPTLQSEGWRDGTLDLRYYQTYQNALANKMDLPKNIVDQLAPLEASINSQLEKYNLTESGYRLPNGLTNKDLADTREMIKEYLVIYFNKIVTPGPSPTPSISPSIITSPSPSPSSSPAISKINLKVNQGFTSFGISFTLNTKDVLNQGVMILQYNTSLSPNNWSLLDLKDGVIRLRTHDSGTWKESSALGLDILPPGGLYLYSTTGKNIQIPYSTQYSTHSTNFLTQGILQPGWSLLWTPTDSFLGDIRARIIVPGQICKTVNLQSLYDKNIISTSEIFIIESDTYDGSRPSACQIFKLLGQNKISKPCDSNNSEISQTNSIGAKKAFWVYLWPDKINQAASNSSEGCN